MATQVIVGVDGSVSALHAARWAAQEATRRGASIRLVHASVYPPLVPAEDLYLAEVRQQGRKWLAEAEAAVREVVSGAGVPHDTDVEVHTSLVEGSASETLVAASESNEVDLVVLGSRGMGGLRSLLAGSVAVALAAHGHCPVVVVRGRTVQDPPPGEGPVVVGVDGSPAGDAAVGFAFAAAARRAAELVAVHVWADTVFDGSWVSWPVVVDWAAVEGKLRQLLDEQVSGWRQKYPEVTVRPALIRGHAVRGLLDAAASAQLLVVGSRGRGALAGLGGLGSTSQGALHHAQCPVAVVRADAVA
jgi:nucleotide-binding universal stress UspA family protein